MILDPGADAPRASSAFGTVAFSTDFHNSFESLPSRKPFPPANLNPTVPTLPRRWPPPGLRDFLFSIFYFHFSDFYSLFFVALITLHSLSGHFRAA